MSASATESNITRNNTSYGVITQLKNQKLEITPVKHHMWNIEISPGSRPMTEPQGSIISVSPKLSLFSLCFPACAAAMTCKEDYQSCYLNP